MRIIDLFSGAGGLTFGFYYKLKNNQFIKNKSNSFVFANEFDSCAATAFSLNYPDIKMLNKDIKSLTENEIRNLIGNKSVDLIIGGPPCQSFSTVGQRVYDEKATMYEEYFRILRIAQPKMFLFENVKGILSMKETFYQKDENNEILYKTTKNKETGRERKKPIVSHYGKNVIDIIDEKFANIGNGLGYSIHKKILNAVDFGVPENRERVFIVGIRNDLNIDWEFPQPIKQDKISVKEAISDLPPVKEGETVTAYVDFPNNNYQILMRGDNKIITSHFCGNYGEKIRTVIQNVKQGQGKNDFNKLIEDGEIDVRFKLTSGFPNTYGRLIEDQPCTTITNNMTTPSGLRCIHYEQDRALTPREGARIQSFPDWFQFYGERSNVTSQIGNAVPPLLSLEIAKQIEKTLKGV